MWTFTPNPGARTDVADTDYVYFGWWLKKAADEWQVDVFAGRKGYGADGADAEPRDGYRLDWHSDRECYL